MSVGIIPHYKRIRGRAVTSGLANGTSIAKPLCRASQSNRGATVKYLLCHAAISVGLAVSSVSVCGCSAFFRSSSILC